MKDPPIDVISVGVCPAGCFEFYSLNFVFGGKRPVLLLSISTGVICPLGNVIDVMILILIGLGIRSCIRFVAMLLRMLLIGLLERLSCLQHRVFRI
jgi:hypothetical protein